MTDKNKHRAPVRPFDMQTAALSTGGLGFLRPAPGTWGSLPPPVIVWAMYGFGVEYAATFLVAAILILFGTVCVACGSYAENRFGLKDAPEVVADETAGVCLPLMVVTALELGSAGWLIVAFALFRLFDIWKPWPVKRLELLSGGWGVLMDDIAAGAYAGLALVGIYFLM